MSLNLRMLPWKFLRCARVRCTCLVFCTVCLILPRAAEAAADSCGPSANPRRCTACEAACGQASRVPICAGVATWSRPEMDRGDAASDCDGLSRLLVLNGREIFLDNGTW